jgi:hypothetical protein
MIIATIILAFTAAAVPVQIQQQSVQTSLSAPISSVSGKEIVSTGKEMPEKDVSDEGKSSKHWFGYNPFRRFYNYGFGFRGFGFNGFSQWYGQPASALLK